MFRRCDYRHVASLFVIITRVVREPMGSLNLLCLKPQVPDFTIVHDLLLLQLSEAVPEKPQDLSRGHGQQVSFTRPLILGLVLVIEGLPLAVQCAAPYSIFLLTINPRRSNQLSNNT